MKNLITLFIRRPVTVVMILSALIMAAVFSMFSLPVNRLPDISMPRVTVETIYNGMTANEVRSLVTIPLEDGFSSIKGLEKIRSVSRDNRSIISMDFRWGIDPMAAAVLVREAVDAVYQSLPEGVRRPAVTSGGSAALSGAQEPHAVIAIRSHNGNGTFARKLAEYELRARLRKIDGAGAVILTGGEKEEEHLSLDVPRLSALGISPSEFANLLSQETADIPAGNAREGNTELVVVSSGKPDSVYDLANIILPAANGTLSVMDAGNLYSSSARKESAFVYNGKDAVALEIYRRPGSDPMRLSRDIKKTINEAASDFSRDALIEIVYDSAPSLISGITGFLISASLAITAVVAVLFLFIRNIKYCFLASLSIPVSAAAGICVLSVFGKSLNSMSLGGLAMGIGLVSDISVIVLDLLHRSFGNNNTLPKPEEIGDKASSIAGSSIASTLTTALVFVPVLLLPGAIGRLYGDLAIALAASAAAGWLYAQFCLPSLYRLIKNNQFIKDRTKNKLEGKYTHFLSFLLRQPGKTAAVTVLMVVIGIICLSSRQMVFIDPDEAEEVCISIVSPPGTLLETVSEISREVSNNISGLPFIKTVYGSAGAEEENSVRRADIDYLKEEFILHCVLDKKIKPNKALDAINKNMTVIYEELSGLRQEFQYTVYFPKDRTEILLGLSDIKTFVITAKDGDELTYRAETIENILSNYGITGNIRPKGVRPEVRIFPDREASAFLSIPAMQIAETLYVLNEGIVSTRLEIEGRPLDVRVKGQTINYNKDILNDAVRSLENIPVKTQQGKTVLLGSLSRIEKREAEAALARLDRSDALYIDILTEKNISSVKELNLPAWFKRADESVFSRYKNSILLYAILILILLYMVMGAQFESFSLPMVLMLSIPFSIAGAGPALLLSGSKFDSGAVLGLISLFGLVVNNSLILYEISNEKINAGVSVSKAVYSGAVERLSAILITTSTTVFALFPLIVAPMINSQKSMAAAMLGGLAVSSLLSLFVIPQVLIEFFNRKKKKEAVK